jgi:uncharacterized membrane protein YhaH (DUF805 family)
MSKKTNTLLFIFGATVFNVLVTAACFTALFLPYALVLAPRLPETARTWGFPVVFIVAVTLSFLVYRAALKHLVKKVNLGKHFEPLGGTGKPPQGESGPPHNQ